MTHLNDKLLQDRICEKLWIASGSLKGISSLFSQGTNDICIDCDEFFGLGQLLKNIGNELSTIEDLIRFGPDGPSES